MNAEVNKEKSFQFIKVEDCGHACCPHCGSEGRYIYWWAEYGQVKGAMAGCYSLLTGRLDKGDVDKHIERISIKQAKSKTLNGWDKTIVRMLDYINNNTNDFNKVNWANQKIRTAVAEAKSYACRKW